MNHRLRFGLLIISALTITAITATRPSGTPLSFGASIGVWLAAATFGVVILLQMWQSAFSDHGIVRILKVGGLSLLTFTIGVAVLVIGLKLLRS